MAVTLYLLWLGTMTKKIAPLYWLAVSGAAVVVTAPLNASDLRGRNDRADLTALEMFDVDQRLREPVASASASSKSASGLTISCAS